MSNFHERRNRKLQCGIWFSYILFSSLIVFDIFVGLNAIEPLVAGNSIDLGADNSSRVDTRNGTSKEEADIRLMVKEFMDFHAYNTNISQDAMAKIEIYLNWVAVNEYQDSQEDTMATLEVLAILVLLLVNLVAILGLKRRQACLLVPWMVVYFTGTIASYFRVLVLLIEQVYETDASSSIFSPLSTGVIFNLAWLFVFAIFKELVGNQRDGSPRLTQV